MNQLFHPLTIGSLALSSRTVRSATWEGMADEEGFVRPALISLTEKLARSSIGLVIPGYLYVQPAGRGLPWQTGIWSDAHIRGLTDLVRAVHTQGTPVVAQIAHAGGKTRRETIGGKTPLAPSPIPGMAFGETPRQLNAREIHDIAAAFAKAADRAKRAGFDGIQLHAAHGYLLSQFLSPCFNQRQDEYGGSPENRRRFLIEVFEAVQKTVGESFPILMKINATDGLEEGITVAEALEATRELAERGLAAVEVSGGMAGSDQYRPSRTGITRPDQEAYFREYAKAVKKGLKQPGSEKRAADIPVFLVGGVKSPEVAESVLSARDADAISMSRPLICEPELVARWKAGDRSPAKCISCNLCLKEGLKGAGIACAGLSGEAASP